MSLRKSAKIRQIPTKQLRKFDWERVLIGSTLPATTKLVAFGLLAHAANAPGGGRVHPGVDRLAYALSLTERSVSTHLERLHEAGFIDVEEHGFGNQNDRKRTEFRLVVPANLSEWLHGWFELKLSDGVFAELAARAPRTWG